MSAQKDFSLEDWLAGLEPMQQQAMRGLCDVILAQAPGAIAAKSYGMPSFRFGGRGLVCFNVWKQHCALYPMSDAAMTDHAEALEPFDCSKGAIRFQPENPIPNDLIVSIVATRLKEISRKPKKGT